MQHLLKSQWMIWGCPHFRKPPNGKWYVSLESLSCRCYTKVHLVPCPAENAPTLSRPEEHNPTAAAAQMQNCSRVNECVKLHLKVPQSLTSTDSEHHSPKKKLLASSYIYPCMYLSICPSVCPSIHPRIIRHFTSVDSWNAIDRLPIAAKMRKTLATRLPSTR